MKKLFILFCTALLIIGVLTLPCYAEEAVEPAEDTEEVDFLGRCEEWLDEHVGAIVGGSATTMLTALAFIFLKTNNVFSKVTKIKNTTGETAEIQNVQSKAINDLIDGLAELGEQIKKLKEFKDFVERFKALQKDLSAIAKVLDTVYSNSIALPQGTKNMVHTLCAEVMKIADSEIYGSEDKADERKT